MPKTKKSTSMPTRTKSTSRTHSRAATSESAAAPAQSEAWRIEAAKLIDPKYAMDQMLKQADWDEMKSATELYSRTYNLPADLIYGMLNTETHFGILTKGVNVMQVLNSGVKAIERCANIDGPNVSSIRGSIEAGCAYLHVLLASSQNNRTAEGENPINTQADLVEAVKLYNGQTLEGKPAGVAYCRITGERMENNGAGQRNSALISALKTQGASLMKHDFYARGFTATLDQTEYVIKRDKVLKPIKFQVDNTTNTFPIRGFRVRTQTFVTSPKVNGIDLPVIAAGELYEGTLENLNIEKVKNPGMVKLEIRLKNDKCMLHKDRTVEVMLNFLTESAGPYIYNKKSEEVHDLGNEDPRCQIAEISAEHREDLTGLPKEELESGEKDGCKWCLPQYHHR